MNQTVGQALRNANCVWIWGVSPRRRALGGGYETRRRGKPYAATRTVSLIFQARVGRVCVSFAAAKHFWKERKQTMANTDPEVFSVRVDGQAE